MEQQGRDQRDDQDGPDKPSYSHVVMSGSTPLATEDSSDTGLARPSTPSNSTYQQHQQHYLTAPPSANSARLSRSASRSRPMPPFTPGFGSRQASFVGGATKTSRSVSRVRRPEGVTSVRGDGELSDDDLDYAYKKNRQAPTPLRPTFLKSATIGGPARRDLNRDDDDEPLGQDDEIVVRDRGEDLIRKRMRERKKAKRMASASANAAAREARGRDSTTTSASSPREGQHDTSFQSLQPERTGLSSSIPSAPNTPALNERQSSIGRGKSTSRARAYPGTSRTVPSTPFGATSSEAIPYEYFPSMKGKGYAGPQSLTSLIPREEDEGESDVPEQASTPAALEPSALNFPNSTSVEGVDWAYLDRPQTARHPRQQERQQQALSASQYGSRNPSRAESIVSDVISDVVRGDRSSAVDGGSRRMSEAGEEDYEEGEGENDEEDQEGELEQEDEDDEDEDDQDDQGVTMRDRQDVRCLVERY